MGEHTINVRWSRSAQTWVPVPTQPSEHAHMMAAPTRQHVSDAAAKVYEQWACGGGMPLDDFEGLHAGMGTVLLTVAEHDALLAKPRDRQMQDCVVSDLCAQVREAESERNTLRAEVERLTNELAMARSAKHSWQKMTDEAHVMLNGAIAEIERLRKGRDDVRRNEVGSDSVGSNIRSGSGRTCGSLLMETGPGNLDPRLGMPQPEGEPVGPMSQRKPYRWGMV